MNNKFQNARLFVKRSLKYGTDKAEIQNDLIAFYGYDRETADKIIAGVEQEKKDEYTRAKNSWGGVF